MERTRQQRLKVLLAGLRAFSERADVSQEQAGRIEVALDELFADDARFEDLVLALASYQPSGGEFLYNTDAVAEMCRHAAALIHDELAAETRSSLTIGMATQSDRSCLPCPCCGSLTIGEHGQYEICEVCGWEDDPTQSANPEEVGGANQESLRVAQARWSLASDKAGLS